MKLTAKIDKALIATPWDSKTFGIETYEIKSLNQEVLDEMLRVPGHYTVKVDPLSSKKILHDYGFYYCDTLIELYCLKERFVDWKADKVSISQNVPLNDLLAICHRSFTHSHFHRDFNLDRGCADMRFDNWLKEFYKKGAIFSILYADELASFMAYSENRFYLGAVSSKFHGKRLGKYLWSVVCREVFRLGYPDIVSPISACNTAVLNLHISLGFTARNPRDVYHRLVK